MSEHDPTFSDAHLRLQQALARARADFLEMPGLRLTVSQAQRLWTMDGTVCEAVLTALVEARFLAHANNYYFIRTS